MCGIAGFINLDGAPADSACVKRMTDIIAHRGPDDEGFYVNGQVALGHRRLSIVDIRFGHQPIFNEDGSICIVFNGEIYNHEEIREVLLSKGHTYKTKSDTETLIHAYEEFGDAFVERLRGMFSFVIWDSRRNRLLAVRDRVGIKPFYYTQDGNRFAFSSEIKAFHALPGWQADADPRKIVEYMAIGCTSGDTSFVSGVRRLPPGHTLVVENGKVTVRQYWDLPIDAPEFQEDEPTLVRRFAELFQDSVRMRLMSEVPLGVFLSGGVDSAGIVAAATKELGGSGLNTFTVGFKDVEDERRYANIVAQKFRTNAHDVILDPNNFWDLAKDCVWHLDEPIGDSPSIPLLLMCRTARKHCTVLLAGEGADEDFSGYAMHRWVSMSESLRRRTGLRLFGAHLATAAFGRKGWLMTAPLERKYWGVKAKVMGPASRGVLSEDFWAEYGGFQVPPVVEQTYKAVGGNSALRRLAYLDFKTWLPDYLLARADKMSMAASIELRVPFLDHHVVEFAYRLPNHMKIRGKIQKYIEKQAFRGVLPNEIINRPKVGFQTPVEHWLKGPWADEVGALFLDRGAQVRDYLDYKRIAAVFDEHKRGAANHTELLWQLLVLELWERQRSSDERRAPALSSREAAITSHAKL